MANVNVVINNLQDKIDVTQKLEELINKAVNTAISVEKVSGDLEVSIALVDDEYIQKLNRQYRSLDASTDVLSFAMRETVFEECGSFEFQEEELLGDVVISLEKAKEQAVEYGHSFEREVGFLVVHGILHLLGYDHEVGEEKVVMRQREEEILKAIDLTRGIN
ncbi:rRNA maturation RNase YbeY [Tepidanaerobacter acetatoxydans]|uniref:rRNA maturation RNase YbeY n=1 Tax=Tepidanaerobacter acetatoxydans TaxID=499229 RepID=UPI001BD55D3B|nr:rRNA maturation RNase YbeY [Tepidanaerobacter acetatoxydans]